MPRRFLSARLLLVFCALSTGAARAAEAEAWRTVFATPQELAASAEPLVCILTIQHPDLIRKQLADKPAEEYAGFKLRQRIEAHSGLRCLVVHFTEVRGEELDRDNVKAILITGRSKVVSRELDAQFYPLIRQTQIPLFGFCGGMQLIGQAYGAPLGPLRALREGEADPNPSYHPGRFKEWGYLPVQLVQRDPLFEGLPDEIIVRQAHAYQLLQVPDEFQLLASSPDCEVEAFKHTRRVVYGTQFHPEVNDDQHPHGRVLLENFFRLIGLGPQAVANH